MIDVSPYWIAGVLTQIICERDPVEAELLHHHLAETQTERLQLIRVINRVNGIVDKTLQDLHVTQRTSQRRTVSPRDLIRNYLLLRAEPFPIFLVGNHCFSSPNWP